MEVNNFTSICGGVIGADHLQGLVTAVVDVCHRGAEQEGGVGSGEGGREVGEEDALRGKPRWRVHGQTRCGGGRV